MKINTKVVFEWNPKSKQYEEIYCDSYEHDGEVAECQVWGTDPSRRRTDYNYPNPKRRIGLAGASQDYGQEYEDPLSAGIAPRGWMAQGASSLTNQDYMSQLLAAGGSIFNTSQSDMQQMMGESNIPTGVPAMGGTKWAKGGAFAKQFSLSAPPTLGMGAEGGIGSPPTLGAQMTMGGPGYRAPGSTPPAYGGGATPGTASGTDVSTASKAGSWLQEHQGELTGLGALAGGVVGYRQAKSQQKGLGAAIKEIDPLKGKFMGEHKRHLGLAEAYRPGGRYSQYMAGQIMGQAAESAGQESQRMIASGITSPSMMRAMARQSRATAQHALPGMELQMSQMALPYEQMGAQSLTQYGGVVEQLASLKGAKAAIDPWSSALSGAMSGFGSMASLIA